MTTPETPRASLAVPIAGFVITMALLLSAAIVVQRRSDARREAASETPSATIAAGAPTATLTDGGDEPGVMKELTITTTLPEENGVPIYKEVGAFSLEGIDGKPVTDADLKGKIWVTAYFFTRCSGPCPAMIQGQKRLQDRLKAEGMTENVRIVSITVDPDFDSAEVLRKHGEKNGFDPAVWLFLRGPYADVQKLAIDGMFLGVDREGAWVDKDGNVVKRVASGDENPAATDAAAGEEGHAPVGGEGVVTTEKSFVASTIIHSTKYALIDGQGRLRGFFEGIEEDATDKLIATIRKIE